MGAFCFCKKGVNMSDENAIQYLKWFIQKYLQLTPEEKEIEKMLFIKNRSNIMAIRRKYENQDEKNEKEFIKSCEEDFKYNSKTEKEQQILVLLCKGYDYNECGQVLGVKKSTILTHVNHLFEKENVNSLQKLIVKTLTGKCYNVSNVEKNNNSVQTPSFLSDAESFIDELFS